jgi:hypothetical protein
VIDECVAVVNDDSRGKPKNVEENLLQCHVAYREFHLNLLGIVLESVGNK